MLCAHFAWRRQFYHFPRTGINRRRFDIGKFCGVTRDQRSEETVLQKYQCGVEANLTHEQPDDDAVEGLWSTLRDSLVSAADDVLGRKGKIHHDWFMENRLSLKPLVDRQNQCYSDWLQAGQHQGYEHYLRYKDARRSTRATLQRTKNEWFRSHADRLQSSCFASARILACVHVFRNAKSGYKSNMCPYIRMENGEFCESADEKVMRWHRHFSGVLRNVTSFKHDILDDLPQQPAPAWLGEVPTNEELCQAIRRLSMKHAAGESGILPEMVRHAGPVFEAALLRLLHRVLEEENMPSD